MVGESADALQPIGPSAVGYSKEYQVPKEMTLDDIRRVQSAFVSAARRAQDAGYRYD